ncbi:MAG: DNA polymerase I [gamma proteobacterium symbiont of Bathyaustriella thionipta]|nr:DNA polymerase I [gamma proteobacterium symbiont of Bathyaustriella thionipta]
MNKNPPLILVDGSSYLFRAYHALPPLTNSKGEATGAIVGVINMLNKLIKHYQPHLMAVVFDAKGKTFRNDLYAEYKAHRPPMPDDLREQIQPLHEIIRAMGLPLLIVEGVEADDVIGTLAAQASHEQMNTLISTGDKDLAQLVNPHVTLINTMNDQILDEAGVMQKFQVRPDQIIDYLALVGDSSDNIPGIPKCGPKTAAKWLAEYNDIDNLLRHADQIKGKIGENLRAHLAQLALSRELTRIRLDVKTEASVHELIPAAADIEALRAHYQRIEARRLLAALDNQPTTDDESPQNPPASIQGHYETLLLQADFERWLKKLQQAELFAFDSETTSKHYMQAELVGLSFAVEAGSAAYVPLAHQYPGAPDQLDRDQVLQALKPLLEDENKAKLGQHLKYDRNVLSHYGISLNGIRFDTMLESYVLNSTASRHNMDALAEHYLNYKTIHFEEIAGKGAKQITFDQIDLQQAAPYAAEDADITLRLHQTLWPRLEKIPPLARLFRDIEIPLVPVLSRIEQCGVLIDSAMLRQHSQQLAETLQKLEEQAYDIAGHRFNLGSPKQIGHIFFEELQLPVIRKTAKGAPSTAEAVLQELAEQGHELPAVILQHRALSKLKSTYTDKLPQQVDAGSGRLHTSYHQAVAATGRLSSSDPNLQNIPIRSEQGRRIRQAFIAEPGWRMVAADYSQIELRIMAHLSQDEGLLHAFSAGLDVHRATAAEVFGVALEDVSTEQRRSAKAINFGLIYGMSAFGLARQLAIPRQDAQQYIDLYFHRYPGVARYMERIRTQAAADGFVETLFGRRLYLPEIKARNGQRRAAAERTAINAPMQGTAADIIKKAMLAVDDWIQSKKPAVRMIMQVHDELVFEIRDDDKLSESVSKITELMQQAARLSVPLIVDSGIGDNWDEAH